MSSPRVAIVTGSSRGIGRAIAERLAADGVATVVNFRADSRAAHEVVATIEAAGGRALAIQADVADPDQLNRLFDAAEQHLGGLDIVVSNVGAWVEGPLADATDQDFDHVFSINARSTFRVLREAARRLRDGGRVVVVSSGVTLAPRSSNGLFAASKAAAEQLARALAHELAPRGITVNSVLPGPTRTERAMPPAMARQLAAQTPLGRLGEPADIAAIVGFLASDAGGWMTGQTLRAGGGLL